MSEGAQQLPERILVKPLSTGTVAQIEAIAQKFRNRGEDPPVNGSSTADMSPLMWQILDRKVPEVQKLLELGANPIHEVSDGTSPIDVALKFDTQDHTLLKLLLQAQNDLYEKNPSLLSTIRKQEANQFAFLEKRKSEIESQPNSILKEVELEHLEECKQILQEYSVTSQGTLAIGRSTAQGAIGAGQGPAQGGSRRVLKKRKQKRSKKTYKKHTKAKH